MTCRVVRSGAACEGKQGLTYLRGLTGETVGSHGISMTVLTLPDGARAKTHLHQDVETAVYVIEGRAEMFYGPRLEEHLEWESGDYVYIPADVAHLVMNRSGAAATSLSLHRGQRPGRDRAAAGARHAHPLASFATHSSFGISKRAMTPFSPPSATGRSGWRVATHAIPCSG